MCIRRGEKHEKHLPSDFGRRFLPRVSAYPCAYQKQSNGYSQRWCVCLQHRDEHRKQGCGCSRRSRVCLLRAQSEDKWLTIAARRAMERTLNTRRILLRSTLQVAIVSLSFFAWKIRVTMFRLPCLMTFRWISATVLRSARNYRQ